MRVVVVGGGASGTLAALHLIRQASGIGAPLALHIVEPDQLGRGVAYSTGNLRHRLNVPAGTAVRFEPGQTRDVQLVALAGKRVVYGFRGDVMGKL